MPIGVYERTPKVKAELRLRRLGKTHSDETKAKMRLSAHKGPDNHKWSGNNVGYVSLHSWVRRRLGEAKLCENCGSTVAKKYEWANLSGEYKRAISDWARLCIRCHRWIDNNTNKGWITRRLKNV